MIPEVGSKWRARDGRIMRVDEVIIPVCPEDLPWAKLTVLNPSKGIRRHTAMSTANFGSDIVSAFLRPVDEAP